MPGGSVRAEAHTVHAPHFAAASLLAGVPTGRWPKLAAAHRVHLHGDAASPLPTFAMFQAGKELGRLPGVWVCVGGGCGAGGSHVVEEEEPNPERSRIRSGRLRIHN